MKKVKISALKEKTTAQVLALGLATLPVAIPEKGTFHIDLLKLVTKGYVESSDIIPILIQQDRDFLIADLTDIDIGRVYDGLIPVSVGNMTYHITLRDLINTLHQRPPEPEPIIEGSHLLFVS